MNEHRKVQLENWLQGISKHNIVDDECCPDFSCCTGKIASEEWRQRFFDADDRERENMLVGSLMSVLGQNDYEIVNADMLPDEYKPIF